MCTKGRCWRCTNELAQFIPAKKTPGNLWDKNRSKKIKKSVGDFERNLLLSLAIPTGTIPTKWTNYLAGYLSIEWQCIMKRRLLFQLVIMFWLSQRNHHHNNTHSMLSSSFSSWLLLRGSVKWTAHARTQLPGGFHQEWVPQWHYNLSSFALHDLLQLTIDEFRNDGLFCSNVYSFTDF